MYEELPERQGPGWAKSTLRKTARRLRLDWREQRRCGILLKNC